MHGMNIFFGINICIDTQTLVHAFTQLETIMQLRLYFIPLSRVADARGVAERLGGLALMLLGELATLGVTFGEPALGEPARLAPAPFAPLDPPRAGKISEKIAATSSLTPLSPLASSAARARAAGLPPIASLPSATPFGGEPLGTCRSGEGEPFRPFFGGRDLALAAS